MTIEDLQMMNAMIYDSDNDEVKRIIVQTENQDMLYVYAYNYNWDNGFDIRKRQILRLG